MAHLHECGEPQRDGAVIVQTKYRFSEPYACGRRYSVTPSLQSLPRVCRGAAMEKLGGVDVDIVAAHHALAWNLADKCFHNAQFRIPVFREYVMDREALLEKVASHYSSTETEAKNAFTRLLYGGDICEWEKEVGSAQTLPLLKEFAAQARLLMYSLVAQRSDLLSLAQQDGRRQPQRTAFSYILQEVENEALFAMESFPEYTPNGLVFDGLGVLPRSTLTSETLTRLQDCVAEKTGLQLRIAIKPWEIAPQGPDTAEEVGGGNRCPDCDCEERVNSRAIDRREPGRMHARSVPPEFQQPVGSGSQRIPEMAPGMKEVSARRRSPELPEAPYVADATDDSVSRRGSSVVDQCGMPGAALRLDGLHSREAKQSDIASILPIGRPGILTAVGNMLDAVAPKVEARVFRAPGETLKGGEEGANKDFFERLAPPNHIYERASGDFWRLLKRETTATQVDVRRVTGQDNCAPTALVNVALTTDVHAARAILREFAGKSGPYLLKAIVTQLAIVRLDPLKLRACGYSQGTYLLYHRRHTVGVCVHNGTVAFADSREDKIREARLETFREIAAYCADQGLRVSLFRVTFSPNARKDNPTSALPGDLRAGMDSPETGRKQSTRVAAANFKTTAAKNRRKREYTINGVDKVLKGKKWFRGSTRNATKERHACRFCGPFHHNATSHAHLFNSILKHNTPVPAPIRRDAEAFRKIRGGSRYAKTSDQEPGSYSKGSNNPVSFELARKNQLRPDPSRSIVNIVKSEILELMDFYCHMDLRGTLCRQCGTKLSLNAKEKGPSLWERCGVRVCRKFNASPKLLTVNVSLRMQLLLIRQYLALRSCGQTSLDLGVDRKTVEAASNEMRKLLAASQRTEQENISYPLGAVMEADETGVGATKASGADGQRIYSTHVFVGVVQRGDYTTLYLRDNGLSSSRQVKRFPKLRREVWQDMWFQNIKPKVNGKPTLHTDGNAMYSSSKWDFKKQYRHYFVVHQKKEYWFFDKTDRIHHGSLSIDNAWGQLKKIIASQTANSLTYQNFNGDYIFAAAWLFRHGGRSLDEKMKIVCEKMMAR